MQKTNINTNYMHDGIKLLSHVMLTLTCHAVVYVTCHAVVYVANRVTQSQQYETSMPAQVQ